MRDWISEYCQQKQGVTQEFKAAWNATVHLIGGKIFVMLGEYKDGRPLLTVKMEPAFSESCSVRNIPATSSPVTIPTKITGARSFWIAACRTTSPARCWTTAT